MSVTDLRFRLRVTEDCMAVLLDCRLSRKNLNSLVSAIEAELASMGIATPPDRTELKRRIITAVKSGPVLRGAVLFEGQPSVPLQGDQIEWARDFFSPRFVMDEKTGTVDYRRRIGRPTVKSGEFLGRLPHFKEGEPGLDVFGAPVPTAKGQKLHVFAGKNVRAEETAEGADFYATADGRVYWDRETLFVDEVYIISGDVGLATGHVSHPKGVVIQGSVLDESRVEAGGDIEVTGAVGAADIRTEGELIVHGGIVGTMGGTITVAGGLRAKFILNTRIEAGGDVDVENEIVNTDLKTLGSVNIPRGRIVGGKVTALGSIVAGQAGSMGLVPTLLIAAVDHTLIDALAPMKDRLARLTTVQRVSHEELDRLLARKKALTPMQESKLKELLAKVPELDETVEKVRAEIGEIEAPTRPMAKPLIEIKRHVHPETTFQIQDERLHVSETCQGPLRAFLEAGEVIVKKSTEKMVK